MTYADVLIREKKKSLPTYVKSKEEKKKGKTEKNLFIYKLEYLQNVNALDNNIQGGMNEQKEQENKKI